MSTAVLISGQLRTFAQCLQNQNWYLFRHLRDPAFFVSCAADEQASAADYLLGFTDRVAIETTEDQTFPEPAGELANHAAYAPSVGFDRNQLAQSILRQLWSRQRVWKFFLERESQLGETFDTFVRLRPDTFFQSLELSIDVRAGLIPSDRAYLPWKARCGGVNDRFAIMGRRAAEAYSSLFGAVDGLLDRGAPLQGEALLAAHLEDRGVDVRNTLLTEFTTVRLPGTRAHVQLVEYPGELAAFIHAMSNAKNDLHASR